MGIGFRLTVCIKLIWSYITGGDSVFIKFGESDNVYCRTARMPFDPFVEDQMSRVIFKGPTTIRYRLHSNGTVVEKKMRLYPRSEPYEVVGRWMHVSKSKRVMSVLQRG